MKALTILSNGHSGSTLLDMLLSSHSKIVGLGEMQNLGKPSKIQKPSETVCSCKKHFRDCPFWKEALKNVKLNGDLHVRNSKLSSIFNLKRYHQRIKNRRVPLDPTQYMETTEEIYQNIQKATGAKVILDSCKNIDRAEILSKSKNIEPIIIHLVRDGRGVVWSHMKMGKKSPHQIFKWIVQNLKIELFKRRNPIRTIFVRYSDLCQNPSETLTRILNELELDYEPEMLKFSQFNQHQIGGNQTRFKPNQTIREDTAWKTKMPKRDRLACNLLLGWLNNWYNRRAI